MGAFIVCITLYLEVPINGEISTAILITDFFLCFYQDFTPIELSESTKLYRFHVSSTLKSFIPGIYDLSRFSVTCFLKNALPFQLA